MRTLHLVHMLNRLLEDSQAREDMGPTVLGTMPA
jgi:hypothetical protein